MKSMMKRKGSTSKGRAKLFDRMCSVHNQPTKIAAASSKWSHSKSSWSFGVIEARNPANKRPPLKKKDGEGVPFFDQNKGRVRGKNGEGSKKEHTGTVPKLPANIFFPLVDEKKQGVYMKMPTPLHHLFIRN